jgi:AraC-like DNA-binding protein
MASVDFASLQRFNQLLPKLLSAHESWHIAGLRLFVQRYYYCIASEPGYAVGTHVHDWFELSQILAGKVEYSDMAKAQILGPGEIFFMASGYEHRWHVAQPPVAINSFQLKLTPLNDDGRRLIGALDDLSLRHVFRFKKSAPLSRLATEWGAALNDAASGGLLAEKMRAWFHLFFAQFLEVAVASALPTAPVAPTEPTDGFTHDSNHHIAEFIRQNLHRPIQLQDIASHFHYSVRHINRIFQGAHGVALGQYILEQKLLAAQQLLATTEHPVKHIALSLGYGDVGYFCRLFRLHLMSTPSEYREKLRRGPAARPVAR